MSVSFSITHLRVPRGFGSILEGLTREVLRDQPEDIPQYAARYFTALLKQREESGIDPAEWAAKLEDRCNKNLAFKSSETRPVKKAEAEEADSTENLHKSKTEDESMESTESDVDENTDEDNLGEKEAFPAEASEEESTNRLLVTDTTADEQSGTDNKESDQLTEMLEEVDMAFNETDCSFVPNQKKLLPEAEPKGLLSSEDFTNVDIGAATDEVDDTPVALVVEKNTVDGAVYIEAAEPNEIPSYTGIANAELCAENLTEIEGGTLGNIDSHRIEKQAPEDTALHSSLVTNSNQQKAADHHEITTEGERMETGESSIETFQSVAHAEDYTGVAPKEDYLVEVNFDDLPEGQPVAEVVEKQSEEDSSTEVLHSTLAEIQPKESYELVEAATIQNQSDTQDDHESEIEVVEKDVDLKEAKGQNSPHALAEEQENTSEFVDEAGKKTHLDEPKQEETSNDNENSGKESEGNCFQNEESTSNELKDNELTNKAEGDKEDELEGYSVSKDQEMNYDRESSASETATEAERKTFNKSAQDNLKEEEEDEEEEDKDNLRALAEAQSEDTVNKKWVALDEQVRNELEQVEVAKEEGDAGHVEDNITLICRSPADRDGDENPNKSEKDTLILPEQDTDKEECSRPQEEEDIMDIPLDDPEANRAAAKIQAGFRGHMTRKKMKPEDKAEAEERQEDRGQ